MENLKVEPCSTSTFTCDLSYIHVHILFSHVKSTRVKGTAKLRKFCKNLDVAVHCSDKEHSGYVVVIPRWHTYRGSYFVNPRFLSI